mgnify:CR=1 FL=1
MSHRISTIVATSLTALVLGLSACSNTTPSPTDVSPSPADTTAPGPTQSKPGDADPTDSTAIKSDLSSKLLVGQVAGFTLAQVQVHEDASSPFPDLENPYYDSDSHATIDPAGCEATGIEQLVVGSEGATENENVRVALGTGTSSPRKHEEYTRRCSEITNHLGDMDALTSIQTQQSPTIDGATDVVATTTHHGFSGTEGDAGFSTYLITGNVGDVNVTVQTYPPHEDTSTGKEASLDTAVAIFRAQVGTLRG